MKTLRSAAVLQVFLWTAVPLFAQDLRCRTETEVESGGALGVMMRFVPGGGGSQETTILKGARMRTDSGERSSLIYDVAAGRMTNLDHDSRTYMAFDMADLGAVMEQMNPAMQASPGSAAVPVEDRQTGARESVELDVSTDVTGERRTIHGLEARRVFLTLEFEGQVLEPQEQGGAGEVKDAGTVVLLTDMWISEPFPEMQAFADAQREGARDLLESARGSGPALGQLLASNPDLGVAMERQAEELAELEGMTLESVGYLVTVPPGRSFDRDAALARAQESLGSQVGGGAAQGAGDQARQAVGRALGGLFGRGQPEPEPEPAELEQSVLFRVRTQVIEVERGSFPDALFEVPGGYTERPLPQIGG